MARERCALCWSVLIMLLGTSAGARAQELPVADPTPAPAPAPAWTVVPRVSLTEAYTDNLNLTATDRQSENITEISPGIHITSNMRRLKGYFDYALRAIAYAQSGRTAAYQNALDTVGSFEAVDQLLFVDFSGAIGQQTINAFGTQSDVGTYSTTNKAEVSNYRISPYLKGRMGDMGNYLVRVTRVVTESDSSAAPGTATSQGSINVDGYTPWRNLGWLVEVSRTGVDYSAGRYTEADVSEVGLSYAVTPLLSVFAKAGVESNNYTSADKQSYATNDVGLKWDPTEHTHVLASLGHRSFGDAHSVSIEQSTALVVFRLSDSRDVSAVPTTIPSAVGGFVQSALSVQRRQNMELILRGIRDTVTFVVSQTESSRVDTLSTAPDDLARATVRQTGGNVSYVHRLTPDVNVSLVAAVQKTWGAADLPDSWLRNVGLSVSGKLTRRSTLTVGLRHASYTGTAPYDENAASVNWIVEF